MVGSAAAVMARMPKMIACIEDSMVISGCLIRISPGVDVVCDDSRGKGREKTPSFIPATYRHMQNKLVTLVRSSHCVVSK